MKMLNVFKKIWSFSKEEQANIKKSILAGFFHAVFNALEFGAIYCLSWNISHIPCWKNNDTKNLTNGTNSRWIFYGSS